MDDDDKQRLMQSEIETRTSLTNAQDTTVQAAESIPRTQTELSPIPSWREVVEQRLKRLQSLLFGVDVALQMQDWEKALGLGLRLVGFLDSECRTREDIVLIAPIMRNVQHKMEVAKQHIFQKIERHAFAQAGQTKSALFDGHGAIDINKIKNSIFYQSYLKQDKISIRPVQGSSTTYPSTLLDFGTTFENFQNIITDVPIGSLQQDSSKLKKGFAQTKMTTLFRGGSSKDTTNRAFSPPFQNIATSQSASDLLELPTTSSQATSCEDSYKVTSRVPFKNDGNVLSGGESKKRGYNSYQHDLRPLKSRGVGVDNEVDDTVKASGFITAKQKWTMDSLQKHGSSSGAPASTISSPQAYQPGCNTVSSSYGNGSKTLGVPRRTPRSNFVPPVRSNGSISGVVNAIAHNSSGTDSSSNDALKKCLEILAGPDGELPDKLRNLEPHLLLHVSNEIMEQDSNVRWDDIAGLDHAKKSVTEMVIWPLLRPDLFQGCRAPPKGLLLFGPPGTGKTMIGKAIAGEAKATFFSISASSLTSKWIGEGEKLVRALFGVATCRQPAVIFIDEIDSLLSQRKAEGEHESSRRLKTQFLVEMEGVGTGNEQLLLIGATNRPQELDEAARRRFSKRLYIPLPSAEARAWIIRSLLEKDGLLSLSSKDIDTICASTEGYSGSDMKNLVKEASMGPVREALVQCRDISKLSKEEMRSIILQDFNTALQHIRPSVSHGELGTYEDWNRQFGSLLL